MEVALLTGFYWRVRVIWHDFRSFNDCTNWGVLNLLDAVTRAMPESR